MLRFIRIAFAMLSVVAVIATFATIAGLGHLFASFGPGFCAGFLCGVALYMCWVRVELGRWL
jgi:hypothetical protein